MTDMARLDCPVSNICFEILKLKVIWIHQRDNHVTAGYQDYGVLLAGCGTGL